MAKRTIITRIPKDRTLAKAIKAGIFRDCDLQGFHELMCSTNDGKFDLIIRGRVGTAKLASIQAYIKGYMRAIQDRSHK